MHIQKKGAGIFIYGDYDDLAVLYNLVHKIANTLNESDENQWGELQLLMNFAYEIRKGKEASRLTKIITIEGIKHKHYGFQLLWPDIILFINALRSNAGYVYTEKLDQSMLYMLEYITENAAHSYDPASSYKVCTLINGNIFTKDNYIFQIYQHMHCTFISKNSGKRRFRNLYDFMKKHTSPLMTEYETFIEEIKVSAKLNHCKEIDIEINGNQVIQW